MAGGQKISRLKEKAIVSLLNSPTIQQAAKETGISVITMHRWLGEESFKVSYLDARRQAVSKAVARLSQICSEAVEVLRQVMNDCETPASARIAAARAVLDAALKAVETDDLSARINTLERSIERKIIC
jgi:hypothetical protein